VADHREAASDASTKISRALIGVDRLAERIQEQLQRGADTWREARESFVLERERLAQERAKLEQSKNWHDWFKLGTLSLLLVGLGIAIGSLLTVNRH